VTKPAPDRPNAPIFILGTTMRSGTNFLSDLIALHPDCTQSSSIFEDRVLVDSPLLQAYVASLFQRWPSSWGVPNEAQDQLLHEFGDAILRVLTSTAVRPGKRLVTKTPSVKHLTRFAQLFPDATLLLIVRDGRAVVESWVNSFRISFERAARAWADAARVLTAFDDANRLSDLRYTIVQYEELCTTMEGTMRRLLSTCELDAERYDFEAASSLPVRGSSAFRGDKSVVHWDAIQRTTEFKPLERFAHWDAETHTRFNAIAGPALELLGYRADPMTLAESA
jgi:hypothetical protein